jgi:predicted PurR-regulated permease PerM
MNTDSTSRTLFLLVALALLGWFVWLIRDVLPPFLIAFALALLLDPVLDRMQRWGVPRWVAVALTFAVFLAAFLGVIAFVVPKVVGQVADLVRNIDKYQTQFQHGANQWLQANAATLERLRLPPNLPELWSRYQGDITRFLEVGLQHLFGALQSSAGALGWVVVIPIVTLYLLIDLDALRARLYHLLPEQHRSIISALAGKVGRVFLAYLRGLTFVCIAYALIVYLALALWLEVPYAAVLGVLAAVLYAVPYVGQFVLVAACALLAALNGKPSAHPLQVALVLIIIGQLFDQLITPRVIGKQVGLHPVIGLFALLAGAQLFGPAGMLFAVPVAAAVRVVLIELFPRLSEPLPAETAADEPPPPDCVPEAIGSSQAPSGATLT